MDSNRHDGDKSTIKKAHKRKHKKLSPEPSPSKSSKHDIHNEDKKTDSEIIYKRETDVPVVPKIKKKKIKKDETPIVVYFDLETTGLDVVKESLTQIAAQFDDQTFSVYIRPRGPIGQWALKNTHLTYDRKSLTLYYKGEKVTSKEPQDALKDFVDFLKSFSRPIILAAHFCHQFDAQILYKQLVDHHLWEDFSSIVNGFADTCLMFQKPYSKISQVRRTRFKIFTRRKIFTAQCR
ncbi:uncharacterized protein LOC134696608 [Mytilus trossulus]|uniref:uncharacterized protein LOC134696608 n=1 Tax=Mytilus trossulus TaxID=6551 RepID=UPI003006DADD